MVVLNEEVKMLIWNVVTEIKGYELNEKMVAVHGKMRVLREWKS